MKYISVSEGNELEKLIPNFKQRGMDLNLNRIKEALKNMGEPCKDIPAIQIVGTNGKGSISSFISSSLRCLGIKAGITTSPHLISWCERICVNDQMITPTELQERLSSLKPIIDKYHLTPFESLIASALEYFSLQKVELLVLEVGLGGRLDATTAHPFRPIIAMGGIGLDHCEQLGNSLEDIAKEKASVITPGSILITSKQDPKVERILKSVVAKQNGEIQFVQPLSNDWVLGLHGEIQKQNAAVALKALESLGLYGWNIDKEKIRKGFSQAKWPGRLQRAKWNNNALFIDCAHNQHATQQLSEERKKWVNNQSGIHWILGIQKQKDGPAMINSLIKANDSAWIVPVPEQLSWTSKEILSIYPKFSKQLKDVLDTETALSLITSLKGQHSCTYIVITGSIYLIGDLMRRKIIDTSGN